MDYKRDEIEEYFNNYLKENQDKGLSIREDLHHNCFNTDYYIIGTYQAKQWLGAAAFDVINYIKEGEHIVYEYLDKNKISGVA